VKLLSARLRTLPLALALAAALGCAASPPAGDSAPTPPEVELAYARSEANRAKRLEREVTRLRADLAEAEQALVAAESGLSASYTRADAVSAVAEARIAVERAAAEHPWCELAAEARTKLVASEAQLEEDHLGAAVFLATRAQRMADGSLADGRAALRDEEALRVTASRVNLRNGPSLEHDVQRVLVAGTPVYPEGRDGEWLRVRTLRGRVGWLHGSLVQ
jgi:hypothetical protein